MSTVLRVDLGTARSAVEVLPETARRRDPGFGLFGLHELLARPRGLPVHHPDQPVVFGVGAVAGRRALALSRFSLVARSPLSGGVGESRVEGPFGPALADTGHDAVVVTGRAPRPSYLLVFPGQVYVLDADDLWGLDTTETTEVLTARHGPGAHVAAIGPAGENLVRFASVVTDYGFAADRMGLGAVLGGKNCKAVVLVGGAPRPVADPAALAGITADYVARIPANPLTRTEHDPPGFGTWPAAGLEGYLGVRNYRTATADLDSFTPAAFTARLHRSAGGCPGCPQDCLKSFHPNDVGTLHQEAVAAFSGLPDLDTALRANELCHRWGVDPVSMAGVLEFWSELRGVAPSLALAEDVVHRRGSDAALLGEGVARAATALGAEAFAMHGKGIELPVFDPRGNHGLALAYAVHPLGPRYDAVEHDIDFDPVRGERIFIDGAAGHGCPPEGLPMAALDDVKVRLVADLMELWSGYDAVGLCLYAAPPTRNLTEDSAAALVSAVTGWDVSPAELREWGRRRLALMRRYNLREGLTSADDTLPDRFFTLPVDSGRLAGAVLDRPVFEAAVVRLRGLLGWEA
ncbi:aldehyde ferredoxin oxidoreductase C-terminal domain-containing protein [Umezawaea sp. Da 62-37]|uniref:aldehyde ferredoxin oxidoreductase C-terminal domain-containing protein n=1 Tax=Umezawaea sp. Da 62-37 TaxID=3075927 RepID=UPI0028F73FD9|nr:aldehyde ferredoxin oxidoreductase C-terminal domain-containing protein [Umezawaea sp. Da 62-37]WNV82697.1 aldehyde ferredoxin oxidoreductase N-terminal domain-containing protein [Umezawaea sp. Da 62-37]